MNIQSILIGMDSVAWATVYIYLLTEDKVVSIEICERENVGLMGWWPVEGEVLATENPKELFELIRFDADFFMKDHEGFHNVEDFRRKYGKYAQMMDEMKIENDTVTLPKVGGLEYGFIVPNPQEGTVEMGKVQFSKGEE